MSAFDVIYNAYSALSNITSGNYQKHLWRGGDLREGN